MSSMLPIKVERVWLVDPNGSATEKKAPQKTLTSGQRHYLYRLGLMAVDQFLKERDFKHYTEDSSSNFNYECGPSGKKVWIDMTLKKPDNIAYVTSYPGYEYKQRVIGQTRTGQDRYGVSAKVTMAKDILGCDYLIQITIMSMDSTGTRTPILIPLDKTLEDPARYVLRNVLGILSLWCEKMPNLRALFTEEAVRKAQEQTLDTDSVPLLPD